MSASKEPIDLRAVVQDRLRHLPFVKRLRLRIMPDDECSALDEGTSSDFTQGIRLNDSVAICLDWWGAWKPHKRYSFTVFGQTNGDWQSLGSRIERIDDAIVVAIQALAEQALISSDIGP